MTYTALIRTCDSWPRVAATVASLRAQSLPPAVILAVDSGSDRAQRDALAAVVDVILEYPREPFNYSKAINVGVARCETPYVLIISSHVALDDRGAVARALTARRAAGALGFYFHRAAAPWIAEIVDRDRFDGRNGLHNTCAFLAVEAVRGRPFREDVFSAEDQEWAAAQFRTRGARILRIGTDAMKYDNPHENEIKLINEEISIAYFTCREKMGVVHLARWLARAAVFFAAGRRRRAFAYLTIFKELVFARFRPPMRVSRYF